MANAFVHVELNTNDPAKAKTFYGKLFDWNMEDTDMGPAGTYTMINPGEGTGGGLFKNPMPNAPSFWLAYAIVDDVKAATAKAKSLGASVMKDVTEVPGMGWFSIIADPTGAHLGLWQTAGK
jgi:predicted enzyme related to lactoylglutathione lyase